MVLLNPCGSLYQSLLLLVNNHFNVAGKSRFG
jgi:hypothetical protein